MRLRYASVLVALIALSCGGRRVASTPAAGRVPAPASRAAAAAAGTTAAPSPVKASATLTRQAAATASLSLMATLAVSLESTGGSYKYTYEADAVSIALDGDGTFDSTAPITASLALSANGCNWDLHLVNPQIEIAGSVSDDGSTLRIASIQVTQDDVSGAGTCTADGGQSARDFTGIGAGTTNLSPAAPVAIPFSDGATASLPQPSAVDRYPRSVSIGWNGTLQLSVPGG